jgi:hypothetical protein
VDAIIASPPRLAMHYQPGDDNTDEYTTRELVMLIDQTDLNDRAAKKALWESCRNNPYARAYLVIKATDSHADNDFKKYGRYV